MLRRARRTSRRVPPDGARPLEVRPRSTTRRAAASRCAPSSTRSRTWPSRSATTSPPPPARNPRAPARDAESFLAALRAVGRGEAMPDVELAEPKGEIGRAHGLRQKWANIGGREPGDCDGDPCLFRWFWNTGTRPRRREDRRHTDESHERRRRRLRHGFDLRRAQRRRRLARNRRRGRPGRGARRRGQRHRAPRRHVQPGGRRRGVVHPDRLLPAERSAWAVPAR